jgi:O-antigen/teichoic acid export membrane protein
LALPAIFRNSLVYMLGNVANGLVPFLLLPILTRYLPPAELGMVVNYQLLFSICAAFSTLSLQGAVAVEFFKRGNSGTTEFLAACLMIMLVAGLIMTSGLFAINTAFEMLSLAPAWLLWCALSAMVSGGASLLLAIWQSSDRPVPYVIFQVGQTLFNAALSLALVVGVGLGADGRLVGLALPVTLFGAGAVVWLLVSGRARGPVIQQDVRLALRFGLPLLPHALASIFVAQGDRLVLTLQAGLAEAGIYAVAMQLLLPFIMVADAINRAVAPWIYRKLTQNLDDHVAAAQMALSITYLAGGAAYLLLAHFGIGLFLGDRYLGAMDYFYILLPGTLSAAVYYAVVNPIFYAGRTELLTAVTLTSTILYLALGWWAAGMWGGRGLAVSYAAINILQTLAVFGVAQHVRPLSFAGGARSFAAGIVRVGSRLFGIRR